MRKIYCIIPLILLLVRIAGFACDLEGHFDFEVSNGEELLYWGCYDAVNKGPHIIEYILTKKRLETESAKRPNVQFTQNRDGGVLQKLLRENGYSMPHHNDFTRSGYDRGHMAPNADFNDTYENAAMTFFIGNIWPQTPAVNRVEWLKTENETRRLAFKYLIIKVIIIVDEFSDKKVNEIQVPSCFKRRVYNMDKAETEVEELVYEIDVYQ